MKMGQKGVVKRFLARKWWVKWSVWVEEKVKLVYHNRFLCLVVERLHFMTMQIENGYKEHKILCRTNDYIGIFWI